MTQIFTNDSDVLLALKSDSRLMANAALKHLYQSPKLLDAVRKAVGVIGGGNDDAKDTLSEALVVFYEQVVEGKYNPALSTITTFIVAIAKKKYYTNRRSEHRRSARHDRAHELGTIETIVDPEIDWSLEYRKTLLDKLLSTTGERCHQLLKLRSFDYSMAEIAEMMQYKTPDVAKAAANECRKKLNKYLAENPDLLAELNEL